MCILWWSHIYPKKDLNDGELSLSFRCHSMRVMSWHVLLVFVGQTGNVLLACIFSVSSRTHAHQDRLKEGVCKKREEREEPPKSSSSVQSSAIVIQKLLKSYQCVTVLHWVTSSIVVINVGAAVNIESIPHTILLL